MSAKNYYFTLLFLIVMILPVAEASQVEQIKNLLTQVQNQSATLSQNSVLLASTPIEELSAKESFDTHIAEAIKLLNTLQSKSDNTVPGLHWLTVTGNRLPKDPLFNAGSGGQVINVCRAPFTGMMQYSNALYPGQLTAYGCRITYGGYAFIVTKFEVLAGADAGLKWIAASDIGQVGSAQQTSANSNETQTLKPNRSTSKVQNIPRMREGFQYFIGSMRALVSPFNVQVNGATPVSGGYDNNTPVIICRGMNNGTLVVGKLVGDTCNVGSEEKEIEIKNNFELLFWKSTDSKPTLTQ